MNVNDPYFERTHTLGCGSLVLRLLMPLLAALVLTATALPAHADGCSGCRMPGLADLRKEPGFALVSRPAGAGHVRPDTYLIDRGECVTASSGTPTVTRGQSWLALRGTGEVWNCPHSRSEDTITVESSVADSSEWSFSVKVAAEFRAFAAKVKTEVEAGRTTGVTITEVTTISKKILPAWCHRITWAGYFEVGTFAATTTITSKQRWAWWTKNRETGDKVHAKGNLWILCRSQPVVLTRTAPIAGYFALRKKGCHDPECTKIYTQELGFFPLIPAYLKEPRLPWAAPPAPGTLDEGGTNGDEDPVAHPPQGSSDGGASTSDGD